MSRSTSRTGAYRRPGTGARRSPQRPHSRGQGWPTALHADFSDAQCGFKAMRADIARVLLPVVRDREWFSDTELLVLTQCCGQRIHEVPVDWVDDPDIRVDIVDTARKDLQGAWRLRRAFATHALPIEDLRTDLSREPLTARRPPGNARTHALDTITAGVGV